MSRFVITGATGGAPNRLEINDFVKNEKYFSLFIQALQAMQQDNQNNDPSYFQVGKIHGLPYKPWNGVVGSQGWNPNTTWGGYCTHGSVLFPTWHRPYMMLHEQIIQSYAVRIAATYVVDQEAWRQAAQTLRHPFWDWAVKSVPPDEVVAMPQVVITAPNGQRVSVSNPLYHYVFHPVDPSFPPTFRYWSTTIRHPTTQGPNATDNVFRLKSVLQAAQSDITSSTYNMLTRIHDWPAFSNHTVGDGGSTSNSLEAIHDGIHGNVGGGGQMSDPSVAAFDPIFFLHHCNVDRLLQLWSALNPGVWVTANEGESGTYTIPAYTLVNQSTALTPFWNGQTSFWDSTELKDTTRLGYSYPDFNGLDLSQPLAVQASIANRVNQLYGSSIFNGLRPFPSGPITPINPNAPVGPITPINPIIPVGPITPVGPIIPINPIIPVGPVTPVGPIMPIVSNPSPPFGGIPQFGGPIVGGFPFGGVPPFGGPPVFGGMPRVPLPSFPGMGPGPGPWGGPFMNALASNNLAANVPVKTAPKAISANTTLPPSTSVPTAMSAASHAGSTATPSLSTTSTHVEATPDKELFDWTARIEVKKYEVGGSFGVLLFLGEVPNNPHDWTISPNYIGSHYAFVNTSASQCANCRSQASLVIEGFVHLNQAIIKHSGLNSLEANVVEPYLTQNLHWGVQSVGGEVVHPSTLEVSVYSTPLSYPPGAIFPVPGERRLYSAITHGREGGCRA